MHLRLITAPTDTILTTAEAKAHLRIYHSDEDGYIDAIVAGVTANIDGAEGWMGRCWESQQWELTIDRFPKNNEYGLVAIDVPLPPLISVDEILYDDGDGVEQELAVASVRVIGEGSTGGAYILPIVDAEWPETQDEPASVRIKFTAGYANGTPESVKWAVRLMVSHFFEHREAAVDTGAKFGLLELPFGVVTLLMPHRYWH